MSLYFYLLASIFWLKIFTESSLNFWKKFIFGFKKAKLPDSLVGKTAVITGANRGIGLETAKAFARLGAKVFIGCRNLARGKAALENINQSIEAKYHGNVYLYQLDLASFASITNFANQLNQTVAQIDYLVNNAGIMMCSELKTADGLELQFGANYLGPFLLTHLLLGKIRAAPAGRIINLSSIAHNAGIIHFGNINLVGIYSPLRAYAQSKLATILWGRELAKRLEDTAVKVYSVHPGLVKTDLYTNSVSTFAQLSNKYFGSFGFISPEQGAQTTLYCAFDEEVAGESGHYYKNCKRDDNMTSRVNDKDASQLWTLSIQLLGFADAEKMAEVINI